MQFPKKLRHQPIHGQDAPGAASMKCSSRRNCDAQAGRVLSLCGCLNEVQLPKELRPVYDSTLLGQNEPQ